MPALLIPALVVAAVAVVAVAAGGSSGGGGDVQSGTAQGGWSEWKLSSLQAKTESKHIPGAGGYLALSIGKVPFAAGRRVELRVQIVLYVKPQLYRCQAWSGVMQEDGSIAWSPAAWDCKPNGYATKDAVDATPGDKLSGGNITTYVALTSDQRINAGAIQHVRWSL